jgi:cytochrome c oxidase cbb3-type subunit I/II
LGAWIRPVHVETKTMTSLQTPTATNGCELESFTYDDAIVRKFFWATLIWGLVAFLVGVILAVQLAYPQANFLPEIAFGRLRPLHTNAAIFAFAGNAIFTAVYYSTQRLCKCRMWSDKLSKLHFWGWQLIIVSAAITLPLGITQSKEYAELEWPIDLAIAVVWLGFFGTNFLMTLVKRRERHMYVALWFYIASIVAVTILHVFNNIWIPVGVVEFIKTGEVSSVSNLMKSYPVYAGVQDAFMQWWYGHNAVAFFLTTPFLGMMYYFLPKAANRPVFSYKLSIIHFWSLVFIYIWAGPHHLHYTALPQWASTLGMAFSLMLWMPSWGGMINGLLTLRGSWHKVSTDPVLKFFVVAITFYGMATFEGPLLSVKTVNALSHYTDWTIAHVHAGTLGWNAFMAFGMMYWLAPRLFQTKGIYSVKLISLHFWIGTVGILLYIISIYTAGITQGLMWRAFNENGTLAFEFIETVNALKWFYWIRAVGGTIFLASSFIGAYNLFMTWRQRPPKYDEPRHQAPALSKKFDDGPRPESRLSSNAGVGHAGDRFLQGHWHRRWERLPIRFTVWVVIAVAIASVFEIIPTFLIKSNVPKITTVMPYSPLEVAGRDIYIAEGCYNCHSQMIRPIFSETERYGDYTKPGETIYDRPFQWGSRRIGPDLAREGSRQGIVWHYDHFYDPRNVKGSLMPSYKHLYSKDINFAEIQPRIVSLAMLGTPYGDAVTNAEEMAREQALQIADTIRNSTTTTELVDNLEDKQVIALIAYMQRLGTDIFATPETAEEPTGNGASE